MKLSKNSQIAIFLVLIVINFSCDQISKSIIREKIKYNERIELIGDNLILTKVENKGAFLSLGSSLNPVIRDIFLTAFPALIIVALFVWVFFKRKVSLDVLIGTSFVTGGGLGNILDRILYGSVTDFLHMDLGIFRTGVFNMADVSVMIGMFFLLIGSYSKKRETKTG